MASSIPCEQHSRKNFFIINAFVRQDYLSKDAYLKTVTPRGATRTFCIREGPFASSKIYPKV